MMNAIEASIFRFMLTHQATYGWPPSLGRIGQYIGNSHATALYYVRHLHENGHIAYEGKGYFAWRAIAPADRSIWSVTLLRYAPDGRLIGGAVYTDDTLARAAVVAARRDGQTIQLAESYSSRGAA
jgi:hypothetical protein